MKRWLPVVVVVVIGLVVAEVQRRDPDRQVRACVARLEAAFLDRDAAAVLAQLHPAYDTPAQWPERFGGQNEEDARREARRYLAAGFFLERETHLDATFTCGPITERGEDREASLDIAIAGGTFERRVPLIRNHRFTFRQTSWISGRYAIVRHAPIILRGE